LVLQDVTTMAAGETPFSTVITTAVASSTSETDTRYFEAAAVTDTITDTADAPLTTLTLTSYSEATTPVVVSVSTVNWPHSTSTETDFFTAPTPVSSVVVMGSTTATSRP
jgi:hypothetical protein